MKTHRFIGNFALEDTRVDVSDPDLVHQIRDVLRLGPGEEIILGNGKGGSVLVKIVELGPSGVVFETIRPIDENSEPVRRVVLFASIIKKDNFEFLVQKATEAGASEIVPIISERTVKLGLSVDRLKKIAKEAAEQSGRVTVTIIHEPRSLEESLTMADKLNLKLFFDGRGGNWQGKTILNRIGKKETIGVFVGPEGGWTEKEINLAKSLKFQLVSLGKLTLRAETAALIAVYLAANIE
ncbi:MAG: RsmE family RNA methyltransferase [Candidatus Liptonbacteria bacterium]